MPTTNPAGIHESTTCDAGPDNGPCELCKWVNESASKNENEQGRQEPVVVTISAVRAAIADVIDAGDEGYHRLPWLFHYDETPDQTAERMRFLDAVERRLREGREG